MADADAWTPFVAHHTRVAPRWIDYNGHMSEAYYVLVFGHATDALLDAVGMDDDYRRRTGISLYTVEAHVCYLAEVGEDEPLAVATQVIDLDVKRVHLFHTMTRGADGPVIATEELLLCGVDVEASRSTVIPDEVAAALAELRDVHRRLPLDTRIGRAIGLPG